MKEYSPFTDPTFDADRLEKNEIRVGKQIYARLPKMPGRIFTRDSVPEGVTLTQELSENDIAFLADRYADEETGELKHPFDDTPPEETDGNNRTDAETPEESLQTEDALMAEEAEKWDEEMPAIAGTDNREGENVTVVPGTTVTAREKSSEGAGKEKEKTA